MRLAAQKKAGFYPAPNQAIDLALGLLEAPAGDFAMLDPCCGKGAALARLAAGLGCKPKQTYAVELDVARAGEARERLPGCHVLGPASFLGCAITSKTFGFVWVNPPFDDEAGGGRRVEYDFFSKAKDVLFPGGVIAAACPEEVAMSWQMRQFFCTWFDRLSIVPFPEGQRRFTEVMIFGVRRKDINPNYYEEMRSLELDASPIGKPPYTIPVTRGPGRFEKVDLTPGEAAELLERSPLRKRLEAVELKPLPEPPLPLASGHIALLLAAGSLDGIVHAEGEPPHCVRGTARKTNQVVSVEELEDAKGNSAGTKTVMIEKIELIVRAIDGDGELRTFTMGGGASDG